MNPEKGPQDPTKQKEPALDTEPKPAKDGVSVENREKLADAILGLYVKPQNIAIAELLGPRNEANEFLSNLKEFNEFGKKLAEISNEAIVTVMGEELLKNPTREEAKKLADEHNQEIVQKIIPRMSYTKGTKGRTAVSIDGEIFL